MQTISEDGRVAAFRKIELPTVHIVPYFGPQIFSWVGEQAIVGYALSEMEAFFVESEVAFRERIVELESDDFFRDHPLEGVEASRYLRNVEAECRHAERAAITIAAMNRNIAELWVEKGMLGEEAKFCARLALEAGYEISDFGLGTPNAQIIEQSPTFARRYFLPPFSSESVALVTGSEYRRSHNIGVFQLSALFLDMLDLPQIAEGAGTEYSRLVARGKCPHVYVLLPGDERTSLAYIRKRGVNIIPSQDNGTPELLLRMVLERVTPRAG
jgi:hypothetical protein